MLSHSILFCNLRCDWLKNPASFSQPIRSKIRNHYDLLSRVFPALVPATLRVIIGSCNVRSCCDWPWCLLSSFLSVNTELNLQADSPKGAISCKAITRVYEHRNCGKNKRHFLFCVDTPDRTYTMNAPSEQSMNIWMTCLNMSPTAIELQRDQT